ncbi:MAG: sensor histidine kinase, partial [Clostridia bacterium]|nr:sensor histidine kinase [Clostridia bacterium]
ATVTVKNTSSYEMNFSAEEISEQFVRGDPSRTGEGSGLGLAIARSLTELQQGTFEISIDADLFKVTVTFPLLTEQE